jgi:hypothetical protein
MKFAFSLLLLASPALAQPTPTPAPTPPPAPAPAPDQQQGSGAEPSWLPGVHDVTAAETATPGKLTLTMARAVELAYKQNPSARRHGMRRPT